MVQARRWWDDLAALVARPGVRAGPAAAVTAELREKLEAYPELLKAALLDGHVLAITNNEHCPSALRCACPGAHPPPQHGHTCAECASGVGVPCGVEFHPDVLVG